MGVSISKLGGDGLPEVVQLHMFVEDSDWLGVFDQIEVQRSRGLSTGPYEPLTADGWLPARVPATGGSAPAVPFLGATVDVVGRDLRLLIDETDELSIVFVDTGSGVLTLSEAAAQVALQSSGRLRSWVDSAGVLVVETVRPGTGAALRVLGGDAASSLGLPTLEPEALAFGRDAHLSLLRGKQSYSFVDLRGESSFFYRTRFRNRAMNTVSAFTQPSYASSPLGVSGGNIVCGRVNLVGLDGRPLQNVLVRIFNRYARQEVEGKFLAGAAVDGVTDASGTLELNLVRGAEVSVSIEGTDVVRDIRVPEDPAISVFNLLDAMVGPDDYWKVRGRDVQYAPRRS